MVIDILVGLALDYVSEKAFSMSADALLRYGLKAKDRHELRRQLADEMRASIEEVPVNEFTNQFISSKDKYSVTFQNGIVNAVLMRDRNKEKDWFVTDPPIPENRLGIVRKDVDSIVVRMRDAMWGNALFRRIVGDERFQEKILADLGDLRKEMSEMRDDLEELKKTVSDLMDRVDSLTPTASVISSPVDPSDTFTGREGELRALDEALSEKSLVFVNGFGGIGKTELCRKFSSTFSERTGCKVVWTTYEGSIRKTIATNVGLSDGTDEGSDIDGMFLRRKRAMSAEGNILLIIDNFEWGADLSDIEDIGCKVILTTRGESIPAEYRTVTVGELSPDESFALLKSMAKRTNSRWIDGEEAEIRRKLEDVGYHTLTIALMGGLIAEEEPDRNQTVDEVFDFTGCEVYSRDRGYKTVMGHIKALFKLSSVDKESVDVLRMAAMLPESGMERRLFMECSGTDKKALYKLTKSGWLKRSESGDVSMISIHPMISELIWDLRRPSIEDGDPCRGFAERALAHIDSINRAGKAVDLVPLTDVIGRMGDLLLESADVGSDPSFAAGSLGIVSTSYRRMGMYADCLDIEQQVLRIRESMEGADALDIARSLNDVGKAYLSLGEYGKALEYQLRALGIRKGALPHEHPDIADSLNSIGNTYSYLGENEKALEYRLEALKIRRATLPEGDSEIATSLNNVGNAYSFLGDYVKALEYQLEALEMRRRALPADHRDIARSLNNVGNAYSHLGDYVKALEYQLEALEMRQRVLPEGHPEIAKSLNNVGNTYSSLGRYYEALKYRLEALKMRMMALPEGHPEIATSLNNVGNAYANLGEHEEALKYRLKALEIRERALPEGHPNIAKSLNNVGSAYSDLGEHEKALEFHLRALEIRERALPEGHPDIAISLNSIGTTYFEMGEFETALEYFFKAIEIRERALPAEHPDIARSLSCIGSAYSALGDYERALDNQLRALEIYEETLPEGHPTIVQLYDSIGLLYCRAGQ